MTSPIISIDDFKNLQSNPNLIVFDARIGADVEERFLKEHIQGARFLNLDKDLAEIPVDASIGGRHPLPSLVTFQQTLETSGANDESIFVIYDDKSGANAGARLWWMLRAFGFDEVYVLDGGFQAVEAIGIEMESGKPEFERGKLSNRKEWMLPTKSISEVENSIKENSATVIDVRDAYRYRGESEPIDLIAGHIPGAINIPFSENLQSDGRFLSAEKLKSKYSELLKDKNKNLIIHCGSGVTACHTILALTAAGFDVPNLYVGSWSEWSRTDRPIAKEV